MLKTVENIVANGEIARFEIFFLLPEYFPKSSAAKVSGSVYMWGKVKNYIGD